MSKARTVTLTFERPTLAPAVVEYLRDALCHCEGRDGPDVVIARLRPVLEALQVEIDVERQKAGVRERMEVRLSTMKAKRAARKRERYRRALDARRQKERQEKH